MIRSALWSFLLLGFSTTAIAAPPPRRPWQPPNQPIQRFQGQPAVPDLPPEMPTFFAEGSRLVRRGILFGPDQNLDDVFNPAAFLGKDPIDGKEKVFLVVRGEKNKTGAWKRRSLLYVAKSTDGLHFGPLSEKPLFDANDWYDRVGGTEDPRYADLRLMPYVDPRDGMTFDGAILYTGFDGHTARVCAAFFNHDNPTHFRKSGPIFPDQDVERNPISSLNPAWNKSPSVIQYRDPLTAKIRNILYVGEGNATEGGIMALEADAPFSWKWPATAPPAIRARPGRYDQNLVEPAFAPIIAPLPQELAEQTGQRLGIYFCLHGDSPPRGYQVGFRIFSLEDPIGHPLYTSDGPFLWPKKPYEISGQVGKVVFASGSVEFRGQRYIYYGGADRIVAVAMAPAG